MQAGLSLMNDSFEEVVKEEIDRELHTAKKCLNDLEHGKVATSMTHRRAAALGSAWRAGLDQKHHDARALLHDISECSSYVSMPMQKQEDIQSFDLQYVLFDFDFESLSAFKMQTMIGPQSWS